MKKYILFEHYKTAKQINRFMEKEVRLTLCMPTLSLDMDDGLVRNVYEYSAISTHFEGMHNYITIVDTKQGTPIKAECYVEKW